jgi:UDP-N-acetylmuramate dehydrogenase
VGELLLNEPLAAHTTWKVGGVAQRFFRPADRADLLAFLRALPADEPLLWLGLGSNLLVRDGGFAGTVIAVAGRLNEVAPADGDELRAEAGVSCARLAREAARRGGCGAEFLAGIPGTLGGALAMNAGAFGGEIWPLVAWVETVDRHGVVRRRQPKEFTFGYRRVQGVAGEWFLAVSLRLTPGDVQGAQQRIARLLEQRAATQPIGLPSCGSVFRNPPGDHAGRLIERVGLKGYCIGAACISPKHANFIINTGGARASDIEALIALVQERVATAEGVHLEPEVRIVGRAEMAA